MRKLTLYPAILLFAVPVFGQFAVKPPATDSIQFVDSAGNDTNDGLSMGSAKLTIMAAYDALPSAGGTINICVQGGSFVNATSTAGQGIWLMGIGDPNFASPPAGWRKAKPVSFVGTCGNASSQQGNKPAVPIGAGSATNPGIWLSGSITSVSFSNLTFSYPVIAVQIGVDSTGAQSATSGWVGANFDNIITNICNSCSPSVGPGWNIGGGDTFDIFINNCVIGGNPNAAVGSDKQAAILIKPTSVAAGTAAGAIITNTTLISGGIKYYEGTATGLLKVSDTYSESISGGSPGIGTVWLVSALYSQISVHNIYTADNAGTVYDLRVDSSGAGSLPVVASGYITSVFGPATILGIPPRSTTDPLVQGETGFWNGRVSGFVGNAQRSFAPSAVRFANIAASSSASWVFRSGGGTITTGITAPDGSNGAAQGTSTPLSALEFYDQSISIAVGDYFIAGVWQRSTTGAGFNDYAATQLITINAAGDTLSCSRLLPPVFNNQAWVWVYQICKVTAAPTSPAEIFESVFINTASGPIQAYAPILLHIPTGAVSTDEAYEIANNLVSYDSSCSVGSICGLGGQNLVSSKLGSLGNCSSTGSPAVCGSAAAGSVSIATSSSSVVVNTSAVTANSQISVTFDSSLGPRLGLTCNTAAQQPFVTGRTAGTSFTISVASSFATHPGCFSYSIMN